SKELEIGRRPQEDEVARRIAERRIDAKDGNLELFAGFGVAGSRLLLLGLLVSRDGELLQANTVARVETADGAAAALAERQVDLAVNPDLAVVVHDGLEPHRPALERLVADFLGDGHLDAIPAPAVSTDAATLAEAFRLEDFPLGI